MLPELGRRPVRIGAFSASAPDSDVLNPIADICLILNRFRFVPETRNPKPET